MTEAGAQEQHNIEMRGSDAPDLASNQVLNGAVTVVKQHVILHLKVMRK